MGGFLSDLPLYLMVIVILALIGVVVNAYGGFDYLLGQGVFSLRQALGDGVFSDVLDALLTGLAAAAEAARYVVGILVRPLASLLRL